ncbi:2-oxoglutarate/malate translocase OMT [Cardiosporidium cionae]|uniref:2-oxoglutarate/malate translocase OMT n=1 Tax=Cardiosporidium cionae TaxID=476202 RepID=A0ABQ7JG07_9APIC|nr:2-oxoglutarate/malate translocase OMT [Cardiosporidium cionae]|eukprot:KAF8822951.1 2-oxoglutarate/malate translocase OMT [Cardiosporidium cionae]
MASQTPRDTASPTGNSTMLAITTPNSFFQVIKPFVLGGLSGCFATTCIQPIDMIKVRLQLLGEAAVPSANLGSVPNLAPPPSRNPFVILRMFIKEEGFFSLYKGLDAGLLRQLTYSTARIGLFRVFSDYLTTQHNKGRSSDCSLPLPFYKKALAGLAAGGLGSLFGTPADLALVRLQADPTLPPHLRRNYRSAIDAIRTVVREEGISTLWRGATPTVLRAMALNTGTVDVMVLNLNKTCPFHSHAFFIGMLATFDQCKEVLIPSLGNGWSSTLTASAISGFAAATLSLPFDFLKTRIQKMKVDPVTGKAPYKNVFDCAMKVARNEGLLRFYAGYPVFYFRVAPHAMITLITMDFITRNILKG